MDEISADPLARTQLTEPPVALRRFDVARGMARFYAVSVQPTLFGDWAVVRRWGRINTEGRRTECWHGERAPADAEAAQQIAAKRRRGYLNAEA